MDVLPRLILPAFPVVVSGPSGVGKTVLCDRLLSQLDHAVRSVSATTRPPRGNEKDGESYFFYSETEFREAISNEEMAEHAEVHGRLYGTPKAFLDENLSAGRSVVLNIDVQGGLQLKRSYSGSVMVFVLPPSWAVLEERLRGRKSDTAEQIEGRLERAREEVEEIARYEYVVVNDDLNRAVQELVGIVRAERSRVDRRLA
ncbi:MAG: guanylate kinase [Candidatus Eisenbacteria bacterium]|uniref:Guanylate kinase n=1 Tax=Eiseniibacteriota bacterium TaxID=2212470 RepID=A0A956NGZ2_UNCEI|nr:guanylate kinase [Candidatus Eisenbacteria bacterium]MCB9463659.1 guanylate kinase [Candidatus Eisenbacteria bacterium]